MTHSESCKLLLPQLTQTTTKADDKNDCTSEQQNYGNVEKDVVVSVEFYQTSGLEFVEKRV